MVAPDWRDRAVAAEVMATAYGPEVRPFLSDRDGRVVAAALEAWAARAGEPDADLRDAAVSLLDHPDAMVRTHAAAILARAPQPSALPNLVKAFGASTNDSIADAALSTLDALLAIARTSPANGERVEREFLARTARPDNYLVRAWAEDNWPDAARKWGAAFPVATGFTMQDYREIARRFFSGTERLPRVTIEVDQKGSVEVELYGPDAPITVARFLQLVDRRFFDRLRFHRVVPNFVVQDGDPRGDGNGASGTLLRDEVNRHRFEGMQLSMAHSGPETASSQWFITLGPQPAFDGTYTVIGRVTSGAGTLLRTLPGDQIRTVRR
jgi:peptidyl-prolyl cis-trans isomerase B (cyclophilin B)